MIRSCRSLGVGLVALNACQTQNWRVWRWRRCCWVPVLSITGYGSATAIFDTLKGQLGLEQHGGRTSQGVSARVAQRILALAVAIWHNWLTDQPVKRSLIAYDH